MRIDKFLFRLTVKTLVLAFLASVISCAGAPPGRSMAADASVERPAPTAVPEKIMGRGAVDARRLAAFLIASNPAVDPADARNLAALYVEEAGAEGVVHDIAFAQMCLETGFLRFGSLVTRDMNNFCGLGSIGPGKPGERFPTSRIGVRAHVQHLKGYATDEPLNGELVDPRYRWIKYGTAPTVHGLAGHWAADKEYGVKLTAILERMYRFAFAKGGV